METLGLIPSDTGRPGGKRTGQIMGHYVSDGGPFEQAAKSLRGTGWEVPVVALLERPRNSHPQSRMAGPRRALWTARADVSPVCASAPESGPLSYRRETTAELDELRQRVPPR